VVEAVLSSPNRIQGIQGFPGIGHPDLLSSRFGYSSISRACHDATRAKYLGKINEYPPAKGRAFHKAVLGEILEECVISSRNRRTFRDVKRKMRNFPL